MNRVLFGDCRETMRDLIAQGAKVQTCVTSPPYWGLRDYGHPGQLGLEPTPEQYVANMVEVFRLVRELLADDGTLWLNLGDSYAANRTYQVSSTKGGAKHGPGQSVGGKGSEVPDGLKPKDLVGIPWRVAFALQQPYYAGRIKNVQDRVWLAAMIDGEGCMFIHKRKVGQSNGQGYERKSASFGAGLEVANTHLSIVERCQQITGVGSICRQEKDRKQPLYRWNVRSNECRWVIEEIYPHLVAKQRQARLLLGCPPSGERAEAAHEGLILLHNGGLTDVDFPAPESLFRPGFYLRSDIIWSKSNPMPESVTDRPTKAHEYIFLLSKSERYYYDIDAIREPHTTEGAENNTGKWERNTETSKHRDDADGLLRTRPGSRPSEYFGHALGRNRRTVWTVATKPYSGAHFATYPPELIEPCILAGSRPGDIVLDPFFGSGTTGQVAQALGRQWIGCELNQAYEPLQKQRTAQTGLAL